MEGDVSEPRANGKDKGKKRCAEPQIWGFVCCPQRGEYVMARVFFLPLASREHPSDSRTYGPAYATLDPCPR